MTFTGKDGHSYIEIMEPQLVTTRLQTVMHNQR